MRIIAGPCQHESLEQSLEIAKECQRVCDLFDIEYIFKASYDKANRTSTNGKRGLGMRKTMEDFVVIKKQGYKILTDFHSVFEIQSFKGVEDWNNAIDVIQIPAFLCRQTDLIQAACDTDKIVNIKKGQFLAPWDVKGILSKTEGAKEVWITERGTSFGYNILVTDFTGIQYMRDNFSVPVVFDVTHSVQKPGGQGDSSGGNRAYVPALANAAAGMGVDNFFLEVHADPDNAPSDGPNMLRLEDFAETVRQLYHINRTVEGLK
jgi:2-dehydro-3-deoxyphosphooctonate aldolase (KDO 8-P synthase)